MVFTSRLLGRRVRARVPAGEHVSTRTCQTPAAVSLTRSSVTRSSVTSTCAGRRARIDEHVSDSGSGLLGLVTRSQLHGCSYSLTASVTCFVTSPQYCSVTSLRSRTPLPVLRYQSSVLLRYQSPFSYSVTSTMSPPPVTTYSVSQFSVPQCSVSQFIVSSFLSSQFLCTCYLSRLPYQVTILGYHTRLPY